MYCLKNKKSLGIILAAAVCLITATKTWAEEKPCPLPAPAPENTWLQQFVGTWDATVETYMEPGKPPVTSKGTETIRPVGGFWTLGEYKGTMMGTPFTGSQTLGYDASKKKYVGTWVDSMSHYMWKQEGSVDPSGKVLTLESEGPCPSAPEKLLKMKDVLEVQDPDHKRFTSYILDDQGKWSTAMVIHYQRKK